MPSRFPTRRSIGLCLGWIVAIEVLCIVFRFGLGLASTTSTASTIGRMTFGVRIHHGYIGLVLILTALALRGEPTWRRRFLIFGTALVVSDLVHHVCVLWPVTGSPQFDLVYPG